MLPVDIFVQMDSFVDCKDTTFCGYGKNILEVKNFFVSLQCEILLIIAEKSIK